MIKLVVEDYCHNCKFFEAKTTGPDVAYYNGEEVIFDTVVTCERRNLCRSLKNHIERTTKESGEEKE